MFMTFSSRLRDNAFKIELATRTIVAVLGGLAAQP
jgi:hypothetical protein